MARGRETVRCKGPDQAVSYSDLPAFRIRNGRILRGLQAVSLAGTIYPVAHWCAEVSQKRARC